MTTHDSLLVNEINQTYSMDIHIAQASLKCVIASFAFAVEQSVQRWDMEEDYYVLNICPHWQGMSIKTTFNTFRKSNNINNKSFSFEMLTLTGLNESVFI